MADFECRELEIGLEFRHLSFDKCKNFSEGSFEPKKCAQVIRVRGVAAPLIFNSNYSFVYIEISVIRTLHVSVIVSYYSMYALIVAHVYLCYVCVYYCVYVYVLCVWYVQWKVEYPN